MRGYPWYSVPGNGGDENGEGMARRGGSVGSFGALGAVAWSVGKRDNPGNKSEEGGSETGASSGERAGTSLPSPTAETFTPAGEGEPARLASPVSAGPDNVSSRSSVGVTDITPGSPWPRPSATP